MRSTRGTFVSAELSVVLHEAHGIVTEQLTRLRGLAEQTRRTGATLSASQRQAERQLDEVTIQRRVALERRLPLEASAVRREAELRTNCETLTQELRANQHALKQLDQLIRQIEMSSGSLIHDDGGADPWVLALRAQVIQGREEERVRLAREVHDGPAQVLANSLMLLETCYSLAQQSDSDKLVMMLDRMRDATREGLREVRRFIADLRPGRIEEQGLRVALEEYLRGYANAYGVQVNLESEALPRLPGEVEIVLYRIIQEALQNTHKYARGAAVTVRIVRQNTGLHLSIHDDGPGFDPHEVARRAGRSSWGLTSMRERADLIGAQFTVTSRLGHGTDVSVVLQLE
jgi:two-component system sensor histidine kinase DegS